MVFHWSLSDSKYPKFSSTLLSILADLNNAIVLMVSTRPLISKSSSPIINPLVTYQVHQLQLVSPSFSCSIFFSILLQSLGTYLSFHFLSVLPCDQPKCQSLQFGRLLTMTSSGRLAEIKWSVSISKSQRILCVSFSKTDSWFIHHLFEWSN